MIKNLQNSNSTIAKTFKFNSVKNKMIAGFMLLTFINVLAFLVFQLSSADTRLTGQALDKSYAYAEHIEKIISPIGLKQSEKLQNKITQLYDMQYKTTGYIGVLDKNLKYISNTDKSKIGTEFITKEAESVIKTSKSVSTTIYVNGKKEYLTIVPLYNIEMVNGVDGVSSATAKVDVPGVVVVSMDSNLILSEKKAEIAKILGIGLILLTLSIVIAILIAATITSPLKILRSHLHKMSEGDLTRTVSVKSKDELLDLADDVNLTNSVLKNMISDIKDTATFLNKYSGNLNLFTDNLSAVSKDVSTSMNSVADSTQLQSNRLSDITDSVNVFSNDLNSINSKTQEIEGTSVMIKEIADLGSKQVNDLIIAMKEVQHSFETVNDKIGHLSGNIMQVNSITETINNIAKQTNLLSLNASIEAARAGSSGAGFVVVANEVKKLAEQTMVSSQSISSLIDEITKNTKIVTDTSSSSIGMFELHSHTIKNTVSVFNNIVKQINIVIPEINEVASTLEHTTLMKDNILTNIHSIFTISENMSASAQEVSASINGQSETIMDLSSLSEKLDRTSKKLVKGIEKFNI
jgi:methyl-accepting chemotaxis protein